MVTHNPESTIPRGKFPFCEPAGAVDRQEPTRAHKLTRLLNNAPRVDKATRAEVLDYVHALQAEAVAVLPIRAGEKLPATPNGVHGATTDPAAFTAMYSTGCNLGVNLGASGLIVVDADTPAEVESWQTWQREHHAYMPTATVSTPGTAAAHNDGGHWWIDATGAGELKTTKLGTATAMTGDRYVLLPGSVRTDVADPNQPAYVAQGTVFNSSVGSAVIEAARRVDKPETKTTREPNPTPDNSIGQWAAATEWDELLTADGWINTGDSDSCGCDTYTAPGTHANPKSATAHTGLCELSNNGGALTVWTDNPPDELTDVIEAKGKRISKFDYVAHMHHDGDTSATFEALGLEYSTGGQALSAAELRGSDSSQEVAQPRGKVDLSVILADDYTPPTPTLWTRTDGANLLYPGRSHSVHGESESGKSLLMQALTAELISTGERVLYLDYEDTALSVVGRLRAMGTPKDAIVSMLDYWNPEPAGTNAVEPEGLDLMDTATYSLVVIDGVTSALSDAGLNSNDGDDVVQWFSRVPNHLATTTGAAVVVVDHVVKNGTGGRFAVGSNQKMGQLTGAAYTVDVLTPPAQGKVGTLELSVGKDRPGGVRKFADSPNQHRQGRVATVTVDGTGGGLSVTVEPPAAGGTTTKIAKAADGVIGAVDVYLAGLDDSTRPTRPEIVYAIVEAYDDGEGMTEARLKTLWQELSPGTTGGGTKRFLEALNRAKSSGMVKRGRGSRRVVSGHDTAVSARAQALVEFIKNEAARDLSAGL